VTLAERLEALAADPGADQQVAELAGRMAAVVDSAVDQSPEALAQAMLATLGGQVETELGGALGPGWRNVAEAAQLQAKAYALLREADAQAQRAELAGQLPAIEQARAVAEREAESADAAERVELGNVRHAEDRHREALDHARACSDAARDAAEIGETPAVQTELIAIRYAASEVADQFGTRLAEARQSHAQAAARAGATREAVSALRKVEQSARAVLADAQAHPESAPRSAFTLSLGMTQASSEWSTLTGEERSTLRALVADLAASVGADRGFRDESRQAGYDAGLKAGREEARRYLSGLPSTTPQAVLPPSVGRH